MRSIRVALDVDDLPVLDVDQLRAADRAVRAHPGEDLRFLDAELVGGSFDGGEIDGAAPTAAPVAEAPE